MPCGICHHPGLHVHYVARGAAMNPPCPGCRRCAEEQRAKAEKSGADRK